MQLKPEDIEEFKRLYKKKFGEEISDAEAYEKAVKLITLVKAIYKQII